MHKNCLSYCLGDIEVERREAERMDEKEALVVCSDKNLGIGITIWDLETGDHLLHIPTCASAPHGLICLRNQYLLASQIQKPGSVGGGVIFKWPLNKHQGTLRSYLMEAIGPLACTSDGTYLAGGGTSGNIYIWEVSSGRLLKKCCAHKSSLKCMAFSKDDSLLISGSEDGTIVIWSTISLLDENNCGHFPSILSFSTDHKAAITGLLSLSCNSNPLFISSSQDGTYKVWNMVTGKVLKSHAFRLPITAIVLNLTENILFLGCANGSIFFNKFDVGLLEDHYSDGDQIVLKGHRKSITALTFSKMWLISASDDCTACIWDVTNCLIIRRLNHVKGPLTNLVVVPKLSLVPFKNHQRISNHFCVSLLEKSLQPIDFGKQTTMSLPSHCDEEEHIYLGYRSTNLLNQHILDMERGKTAATVQMKVETNREYKMSAMNMTKHTMKMSKYLQLAFLDLMQYRLLQPSDSELPKMKR